MESERFLGSTCSRMYVQPTRSIRRFAVVVAGITFIMVAHRMGYSAEKIYGQTVLRFIGRFFAVAFTLSVALAISACGGGGGSNSLAPPSGPVSGGPTISGTPPTTAQVGALYSFTPTSSGTSLVFAITNKPSWATFSTTSGALTGTPTATGTTNGIVISVASGTNSASLTAFNLTVGPAGTGALSITGTPATTVAAGNAYSFTPATTGAGTKTFSMTGTRPAWLAFSASNGMLSGTPAVTDAGTTPAFTISVSDGTTTKALGSFTITVTQAGNGKVTLNWTAPSLDTDGNALAGSAVTSYTVYYGTNPANLSSQKQIAGNATLTTQITGLDSGTYYFAMITNSTSLGDSNKTNLASMIVP